MAMESQLTETTLELKTYKPYKNNYYGRKT
jgi:hypothetical protein